MDRLTIGTLNLRNIADRWDERLPLLLADMAALQPDLLGLQECVYPVQQDRLLGAAGAARYEAYRAWAGRPEYGNSLLVRQPLAGDAADRLELGRNRSALRVDIGLPSRGTFAMTVTHLHHVTADESIRDEQAAALLAWLGAGPAPSAEVVVGDFNAGPDEPAYRRMTEAGFRSAHREANGAEPAVTWPSGIKAPGMDREGPAECLDYIWLRGAASAEASRLAFDRPAVDDPTLFPSDHFGLIATVRFG
ncbi:MAG: endonuclease/exonuclease/phosphatase family protein [Chloroflexi bacterium]|nr:endonuclease/exonuclease/phosphatase family protein [Chloroflexota bacterium]